jgi:hypothetical protein
VTTALAVNRRVITTVERVTEPLLAPLDAIGVTKIVRQQVTSITTTVETVVGGLEDKGRTGLLTGDGAAADVIGGVIDNVLAYLRQNPEVAELIDAQVQRLLPVLGAHPAVQQLVRDQVSAILPELVNEPAVQELIRAQAGQYIAYLQTAPRHGAAADPPAGRHLHRLSERPPGAGADVGAGAKPEPGRPVAR